MHKNTFTNLVLIAIAISAWFIPNKYASGLVTGFCLCLLILSWIGRRQANRAINIVEKKIRDYNENN